MSKAEQIWDLLQAGHKVEAVALKTAASPRYVRYVAEHFHTGASRFERIATRTTAERQRAAQIAYANGHKPKWTQERDELIAKMWADGYSATQISRCPELRGRFSRNAVIGRLTRIKAAGRHSGVIRKTCSKTRRSTVKKNTRPWTPARTLSPFARLLMTTKPDPLPITEELPIPPSERKRILVVKDGKLHANDALDEASCRWPIGDPGHADFGFCPRRKAEGLPYCPDHAQRAFQPPQPRRYSQAPAAPTPVPTFASSLEDA